MADLQTKSAQDAQALMASVTAVKQEWLDAAQAISQQYLSERPSGFPSPAGSKSYLADADAVASILGSVDAGLTPQQAGEAIGIRPETVTNWLRDADHDAKAGLQTARVLFAVMCQRASQRRRQRLLQRIEAAGQAGPQYWTAPAWLLERGYGNDYKIQQDKSGGNVVVQVGVFNAADVQISVGDNQIRPDPADHNAIEGVVIPSNP